MPEDGEADERGWYWVEFGADGHTKVVDAMHYWPAGRQRARFPHYTDRLGHTVRPHYVRRVSERLVPPNG